MEFEPGNEWLQIEEARPPWWNRILTPRGATMLACALILTAVAFTWRPAGKLTEAGPFDPPVQEALDHWEPLSAPLGFEIWGTHSYVIEAEIMARERYRFDKFADVCPVDFLLAWGAMTQEPAISTIKYTQSGRFGYYEWSGHLPLTSRDAGRLSSNTHIIPDYSQEWMKRELLNLRRGDAVRFEGYLVMIEATDGTKWQSSLTRNDSGGGACEILYVTSVEKLN